MTAVLISSDVRNTLALCIASAWLLGSISRGRASEIASALMISMADIENLKIVEEANAENDGDRRGSSRSQEGDRR